MISSLKLILIFVYRYGIHIFHSPRSTELYNNHMWFNNAVTRWLDIALYKAMQRILKVSVIKSMLKSAKYIILPVS